MFLASLGASLAYSTDVLFGKMALEEMPMFVFVFILALCYSVLAMTMFLLKPDVLKQYLTEKKNIKPIIARDCCDRWHNCCRCSDVVCRKEKLA